MVKKKEQKQRSIIPEILEDGVESASSLRKRIDWQQAMEEFLFWKQAQGISEATLKGYKNHIQHFYKKNPDVWTEEEATKQALLRHMGQEGIKPATYNLRLIYLKAFYSWCMEQSIMRKNPLDGYKKRKAAPRIVEIPTEVLQRLLTLPDQTTFVGLRDYSLILLTLDCGIRPSEAFPLLETSFDIAHFFVTVPPEVCKTRRGRTMPISLHTAEVIKKLIRVRPEDWEEDEVPVFCNSDGESLNRKAWSLRMEQYSRILGFKIRPYDLRHAFAIMYLRNKGNPFSLQRTLGHENLDMTNRYLNISGQDLKNVHQQASPVRNLVPKKKSRLRKL